MFARGVYLGLNRSRRAAALAEPQGHRTLSDSFLIYGARAGAGAKAEAVGAGAGAGAEATRARAGAVVTCELPFTCELSTCAAVGGGKEGQH